MLEYPYQWDFGALLSLWRSPSACYRQDSQSPARYLAARSARSMQDSKPAVMMIL